MHYKYSKKMVYRMLRCQGIRLYSTRSWLNISGTNCCMFKRNINTGVLPDASDDDVGYFTRWKERVGLRGALRYYPGTLHHSGFRLYLSAAEASRYNNIYDHVDLPDTLTTWHKLTSLHIWLIMTRLALEGREGKRVKNGTIESFIIDTQQKIRNVGKEMQLTMVSQDRETLHQMFLAALVNYDEGFLGSDKHLAGAIWRSLFDFRPEVDPSDLETIVAYIRKQAAFLQTIPSKSVLTNGLIPFLPVVGDTIPKSTVEYLDNIKDSDLQSKQLHV